MNFSFSSMLGFAFIRDLPIKAKLNQQILSTRFCLNPLTVHGLKTEEQNPSNFYSYI
jgi:hypothetical protein